MAAGPLVLELFLVFGLTLVLLHKYGNWRKQHLIVTVSTFVGWYFSFIIIFILPLDVSLTFYNKCQHENENHSIPHPLSPTVAGVVTQTNEDTNGSIVSPTANVGVACEVPGSYVADHVLLSLWRVVYWSAQLLTWIVLPLMQTYSQAGDFTALGKLRTAAYNNAIYYGSYLLIFGLLLMYAAAKGVSLNAANLKVLLVTASNTWGLFLLVLLLGYGLVEVPRQIWQTGSKGYRLNKTYFDIEKMSADKNDAEETLKDVYRDALEAHNALRDSHPFRSHGEIILAKFPPELRVMLDESAARRARISTGTMSATDAANVTISSEKYLVSRFFKTSWCLLIVV
uniref:LMBR1 domain containing 2 n=1 Tax=Plectus sambesii TaxID=2011161 RepID=A0A914XPW8_9BILA